MSSINRAVNQFLGKIGLKLMRTSSQWVRVDYPVHFRQRWGKDTPNPFILELLEKYTDQYSKNLKMFNEFKDYFAKIPLIASPELASPHWLNTWLGGLDAISIYGFIAQNKTKTYFEIGSGNSTKFARQAISDHHLQTQIISVDPHPRAEIDSICDMVIRSPLETCDISEITHLLTSDDILFFDGSHQCYQNSDVTVFFSEVLPQLPKALLIGIHDIYLPLDYPPEWLDRHYTEQYLLLSWLLGDGGRSIKIELPCTYLGWREEVLDKSWTDLWTGLPSDAKMLGGTCFWFRMS